MRIAMAAGISRSPRDQRRTRALVGVEKLSRPGLGEVEAGKSGFEFVGAKRPMIGPMAVGISRSRRAQRAALQRGDIGMRKATVKF
jgi:hypothetical protein